MFFGASTSCFYPLETELSLKKIASLGIKNTEIFFNTTSELDIGFLKMLKKIADDNSISVRSVHPFTAFAENYLLFTSYERRFKDGLEFYKRYYEACNILNSNILVLHGARKVKAVPDEQKFERFGIMAVDAEKYGVTLAQENVVNFSSESPEYLFRMKNYLGDKFKMVLDIKQALRSGYDALDFVKGVGESIVHIHVSDNNDTSDCLPPGKGTYDLALLKSEMKKLGYNGSWIVELYNNNYKDDSEIVEGVRYISKL